jgi:aspartyl-tRNA(Asn)/glutamyl-tRNA(Gln) amidotransferase subunit A
VADLAAVYDALQGRDPADDFQADKASERTGNLLERGLDWLLRAAGGYFTTWCDDDARAAVDRVAHALGADSELQFADAAWHARRLLSSAPAKAAISICRIFASRPSALNPTPASGCWPGR